MWYIRIFDMMKSVMLKTIIFDVSNVKIRYIWHLEKFNVVKNYTWSVINEKNNCFDVLWHHIKLFL